MPSFANNGSLFIMAITKAVIAVVIVCAMAYCLIAQIPIPDNLEKVILLIIGAYFGFSAKVYHESEQNKRRLTHDYYERVKEAFENARE